MRSVYCSGALFSPEDLTAMEHIAAELEAAGFGTYLPHRDGVEAFALNAVNAPLANLLVFRPVSRFIERATFALDIFKILECDCFVFNMNGRAPDEGGVVETGVAFAAGKPVVVYRDDSRDILAGGALPLLVGAAPTFETVSRVEDIPAALDRADGSLQSLGPNDGAYRAPPFVERTARFGGKVDAVLRVLSFLKPDNVMAPV